MSKPRNRILSLVLAAAMTLGVFTLAPMTAQAANPVGIEAGAETVDVGDTVYFGHYPQTLLGKQDDSYTPIGTGGVDYVKVNSSTKTGGKDWYYAIEPIKYL